MQKHLAPVVQKVDIGIHWINLYPVDNTTGFLKDPLNSDLSVDSVIHLLNNRGDDITLLLKKWYIFSFKA